MNITKYKKLIMTEHKTDTNITKIDKYRKNWTALLPRNTKLTWTLLKLSITKIDKYKKNEKQFYGRPQNTWTLLNIKN